MTERKIKSMHKLYGRCYGERCRKCTSYHTTHDGGTGAKCALYGLYDVPETNWDGNYDACGMFRKPLPSYTRPVYRAITEDERRMPGELLGQMTLFDGVEQ